jgi:hypothetical protein
MLKTFLAFAVLAALSIPLFAQSDLVQIEEHFDTDPGWEGFQNRMKCVDCPEVIQDFGWSPTQHTGGQPGEIGGRVDNSRYQAYYALPIGNPLTLDDTFSASGTLAIKHIGLRGVGYIGFFNPDHHTWRVWNSMAFRIWEEGGLGQVMFDWMSADWKARGAETAVLFPADGQVHQWGFAYDPDAKVDPEWRDKVLEKHITEETGNGRPYELQGEEHILERAKKDDPTLTARTLRERLLALRDQGLVEYFHRHGQHRWWKRPNPEDSHGKVTLTIDQEVPYVFWLDTEIREAPFELTRFGLFNIARFGEWVELYLGDLTVNGSKIDLTKDPHWEGRNNRVRYVEPNFQAMNDYGYSQTNWAGEAPGEVGGLFWRTEPEDPNFSYYGDDIGELTLEDPISFSGNIYFLSGMTDAAGFFGYFNSENHVVPLERGSNQGSPMPNSMGIQLSDSSAVGYYFRPFVNSGRDVRTEARGPVFTPGEKPHAFTFDYDPAANDGLGRIAITLDGKEYSADLAEGVRESGATFNRFGFANVRRGGHSVQFYLDDLKYTARRAPGEEPEFHDQEVLEVAYPKESAGRKY